MGFYHRPLASNPEPLACWVCVDKRAGKQTVLPQLWQAVAVSTGLAPGELICRC